MPIDPHALSSRLERERGIFIAPQHIDVKAEELDSTHEGNLIAEYGFDSLVRYYAPRDPRLMKVVDPMAFDEGGG